ncbi:MAG: biotin carboxylase [Thermoplasmata archaeon]|nr:biotin carboxylase [Thermoplasmata archaeon]
MAETKIPKRIASIVINALKGGVVPRVGLSYITVGRKAEIDALLADIDMVMDGGATFRFVEGRYGSGKSFLLQAVRNYVMDRGFVVIDADLSPERKLHGNNGQGLATYRELISKMSTKTRPEGGALGMILDRWLMDIEDAVEASGINPGESAFYAECVRRQKLALAPLNEMVRGVDFSRILLNYSEGRAAGDSELQTRVMKWLRAEYSTRTESKRELGVNLIITDDDWYEYVKLFAVFLHSIGYSGMMMMVDELVNIYKIVNRISRESNYEKILTMYNDALQGKAKWLGIIMCGTPECISDTRRGIYSYEALRSRLTEGRFSKEGCSDMLAPVIKLNPLNYEEMTVLVEKLADIHAVMFGYQRSITEKDLILFIKAEYSRIGADSHITPREVIRDFVELLDILYQHPETNVGSLLGSGSFEFAKPGPADDSDSIPEFEL